MREMRGVMTMHNPSFAKAGSWKVMDFPPPVGRRANVSPALQDRLDDFFLQWPERRITPVFQEYLMYGQAGAI
jgi:hypothetical protein